MRDFRREKEQGLMGLELEKALEAITEEILPIKDVETVSLEDSRGRILSEDVKAVLDLPPFDRSPLDGYALRSVDVASAAEQPVTLSVIDTVQAGRTSALTLTPGTAVRLMTGAPIPQGADCVTPFERVEEHGDRITLKYSLKEHENICFRGEDSAKGSLLVRTGTRLDWRSIGALASNGFETVRVRRRPRIAVFSTGDELVARTVPPEALAPGKIYESNALTLTFALAELGFAAENHGIQPDDPARVASFIAGPLAGYDLIVTSGGVSTGDLDIFHDALDLLEARTIFRWVKIRPGSPVMVNHVGRGRQTVLASLSGNPFAAVVNFHLFVRAILARLTLTPSLLPCQETALMGCDYPKRSPVRRFLRATLNDGQVTLPTGDSPGMIANVAACNVLIDVPAGTERLNKGDRVQVLRIHSNPLRAS
ncbi:MAG: molybdopterin molybdotransferase MoeA [Fretibacterium sp.]|nr:molybdopterin molybdotransferase MoeA [Fretibacterium sp.]